MDEKFQPAIAAIKAGNRNGLIDLLKQDPSLATARSSQSHPTLLQCLTLDAVAVPNKLEMAAVLIDAGADINEALVAAASIDNVEVAELLLDRGAAPNGVGVWSPLEEAVYWGNQRSIDLLLARGATVHNLRLAAGLGRLDMLQSFFQSDGSLRPAAGRIAWPFGDPQDSNLAPQIKQELQAKVSGWSHDRQSIINNAFVYACMHNQLAAAALLLEQGAEIHAIPPGFDYSGTGLHYAAINGHRPMVEFLLSRGASARVKDTKVHATPAGWADYCGHTELRDYLEKVAGAGD